MKVNENEFQNYTIVAIGWSYTLNRYSDAWREFNNLVCSATLYGNRPDGTQAILANR